MPGKITELNETQLHTHFYRAYIVSLKRNRRFVVQQLLDHLHLHSGWRLSHTFLPQSKQQYLHTSPRILRSILSPAFPVHVLPVKSNSTLNPHSEFYQEVDPSLVAYPDVGIQHGIQVRVWLSRGPTQFGHDDDEGEETNHSN